jgi:hypothetical protein
VAAACGKVLDSAAIFVYHKLYGGLAMTVEIKSEFPSKLFGTHLTASKDDWYDLGALATYPAHSPIPAGKQLWIGYMNVGSQDKSLDYELRVNNPTKSAGNVADTTMIWATSSDPSAGSKMENMTFDGDILTVAPLAASTGVEKLWLRVASGTNTVASFDWWIYYLLLE